jgi:hypothetical protein
VSEVVWPPAQRSEESEERIEQGGSTKKLGFRCSFKQTTLGAGKRQKVSRSGGRLHMYQAVSLDFVGPLPGHDLVNDPLILSRPSRATGFSDRHMGAIGGRSPSCGPIDQSDTPASAISGNHR